MRRNGGNPSTWEGCSSSGYFFGIAKSVFWRVNRKWVEYRVLIEWVNINSWERRKLIDSAPFTLIQNRFSDKCN